MIGWIPCSLTLVLSKGGFQTSKAQSVAKPSLKPVPEYVEGASMAVSSTMFERLFEGDLLEGRGPESCILIAETELVAIQSLASLRGDSRSPLLSEALSLLKRSLLEVNPSLTKLPNLLMLIWMGRKRRKCPWDGVGQGQGVEIVHMLKDLNEILCQSLLMMSCIHVLIVKKKENPKGRKKWLW